MEPGPQISGEAAVPETVGEEQQVYSCQRQAVIHHHLQAVSVFVVAEVVVVWAVLLVREVGEAVKTVVVVGAEKVVAVAAAGPSFFPSSGHRTPCLQQPFSPLLPAVQVSDGWCPSADAVMWWEGTGRNQGQTVGSTVGSLADAVPVAVGQAVVAEIET